jgi:hypothetical protein
MKKIIVILIILISISNLRSEQKYHVGLATTLSFIFPGMGQIYVEDYFSAFGYVLASIVTSIDVDKETGELVPVKDRTLYLFCWIASMVEVNFTARKKNKEAAGISFNFSKQNNSNFYSVFKKIKF